MRNCNWYLWLNGKKIFNIRELRENFDTAVLSGYFFGGSLMKWLSDIGELNIVRRLSEIDLNADIGSQLEFAFGVSPDKKLSAPIKILPQNPPHPYNDVNGSAKVNARSFYGGAGSFYSIESSFAAAVFSADTESSFSGSFGTFSIETINLASTSGYGTGSYNALAAGQALSAASSGAFASSSGLLYSFGQFSFGSYKGFAAGSFNGFTLGSSGSFMLSGGILRLLSSGLAGSGGSFAGTDIFFENGSFVYKAGGVTITAEEYRRTLINLTSCPLNAYGYGINLI